MLGSLRGAAQRSMVNGMDETGWNVAAQLRWLWVVVSEQVTVCDMATRFSRGPPVYDHSRKLRSMVACSVPDM